MSRAKSETISGRPPVIERRNRHFDELVARKVANMAGGKVLQRPQELKAGAVSLADRDHAGSLGWRFD